MRLFLLCLLFPFYAWADQFVEVSLTHRSADEIQQRLGVLVDNHLSIVADRQSLLLRGSKADVESLVRLIRKLDKPLQQLQVWVYRGNNPNVVLEKFADKQYSTKLGNHNRLDQALVIEGGELIVTETELLVLSSSGVFSGQPHIEQERDELRYNVDSIEGERFFAIQHLQTGIHVVPTLLANQQVSLWIHAINRKKPTTSSDELVAVSLEYQSTVTVALGQWTQLSQQQGASPELTANRKVISTKASKSDEPSVWVKVALAP